MIPDRINGIPVTAIGERAFYGDNGLTSVTIPSLVRIIGRGAFYDCNLNPGIRSEIGKRFGEEPFWGNW